MKKVTAMIGLAALLGLTACSTETTKEEKTVPKEETKLSDTTETQTKDSKTSSNEDSNVETYNVSGTEHKLNKGLVEKRTKFLKENPLFELDENGKLNVVGVGLGDSYESVKGKLGKPDTTDDSFTFQDYTYYIPSKDLGNQTQLYTFVVHIKGDENDIDAPSKVQGMELFIDGQKGKMPSLEIPKEFSNSFEGEVYTSESNGYSLDFQNKIDQKYQTLSLNSSKIDFEETNINAELHSEDYFHTQMLKNDVLKYKAINLDEAIKTVKNYYQTK